MKYLILSIIIIAALSLPVSADELTAPTVPNSGAYIFPEEPENFTDGLLSILSEAMILIKPAILEAAVVCTGLIAISVLVSILNSLPGASHQVVQTVAVFGITTLLFRSSSVMTHLAWETITDLSNYGKLLFPVLTAAVAAQGGASTSAALYVGTAAFDAVLCSMIEKIIIPMVYLYITLSVVNAAIHQDILKKIRDFFKWLMTWSLKTILYVFVGYMGITGVISGATDAAALKAAKLTISSVVPVVGGILSDASEAILVSANVVKSTVGVYGLLALLSVVIGPFITIGAQYLLLKTTGFVCGIFNTEKPPELIDNFSTAMGFLLAVTGSVCLLLIVSTVCFMKGVT